MQLSQPHDLIAIVNADASLRNSHYSSSFSSVLLDCTKSTFWPKQHLNIKAILHRFWARCWILYLKKSIRLDTTTHSSENYTLSAQACTLIKYSSLLFCIINSHFAIVTCKTEFYSRLPPFLSAKYKSPVSIPWYNCKVTNKYKVK